MKKVILLLIIIGMLLNTVPLNIGAKEIAIGSQPDMEMSAVEKSINTDVKTSGGSKSLFPSESRLKEPEYVPGELIVKFKDGVNMNIISTPSNKPSESAIYKVITDEGESTMYPGETITIGDNSFTIPCDTTNTYETLPISTEGFLTTGIRSIDELNMQYGATTAEHIFAEETDPSFSNIYKLQFPSNMDMFAVADEYSNDINVEFAEPNYIGHLCGTEEIGDKSISYNPIAPSVIPDDPYFDMQWALDNTGQNGGTPDADIDAPEAWDTETGDEDVVIAVIDTGVDYTNPDLGNCTQGIIEIECNFESPHPINDTFGQTISFPEYDSFSVHFTRINLVQGAIIFDFAESTNYGFIGDVNLTDYWLPFTEYGYPTITIEGGPLGNGSGGWGYKIDKVKLMTWTNLSEQSDKFVDGYDFRHDDPDPIDYIGHGTHCAGIAAAVMNNGVGIAGVAPNCKIMPIKVGGWSGISEEDAADGINYAVDNGADIISMSWGGPIVQSKLVERALIYADLNGVVLVAAAGNDAISSKELSFPASYDKVIAVAATDRNDTKTLWSNYGPWVDVAAPGNDILSLRAHATDMYDTYPPWKYCVPPFDTNAILYRASGTSMSCPMVAGVVALILSKNPSLTPREVLTVLRSSTDPVNSDKYIGTGRINAHTAVDKAAHVVAELDDSLVYKALEGRNAVIKGTAKGLEFERYTVEYGLGIYPDSWNLIGGGTSRVYGGKLASWDDTTTVEDGVYSIRLTVTSGDLTYEDRTTVIVDNVASEFYVDDDYTGSTPGWQIDHFDKIQDAINICAGKDKIYVSSGTYYEALTVESGRSAILIGENREDTIINSSGQMYEEIDLFGSINISHFTVESSTIIGFFTSNNVISDNKFIYTNSDGWGILLAFSSNNVISKNIIINLCPSPFNSQAISLAFNAHDNIISDNIIENGDGIKLALVAKRNTISGNNVNFIGLSMMCHNNEIFNNIITGDSYYGSGLGLACGRFNKIHDNDICNIVSSLGSPTTGIALLPSNGDEGLKLLVQNSIFNEISNNTISNCDYGIILSSEIFEGLILPSMTYVDINATCKFNSISYNDISNTEFGITMDGASDNFLIGNNITNNENGISIKRYIDPYSSNTLDADDNHIYYNNFIDNTHQAYDECDNTWYRPILGEGNYWSDYSLKYPGAQIIHRILRLDVYNIPYDIVGGTNRDLYPLANQHSNSQSTPQSQPQTQPSTQPSAQPSSQPISKTTTQTTISSTTSPSKTITK